MRRFLLTMATATSVLAITACSDITGPRNLEGTYTLQTINGRIVPVTVNDPSIGTVTIIGGEVTLDIDGSFIDTIDYRFTGSSQIETQSTFGTYERSGNTITFFSDDGGEYTMIWSSGNRLIQDDGTGLRLVYQR